VFVVSHKLYQAHRGNVKPETRGVESITRTTPPAHPSPEIDTPGAKAVSYIKALTLRAATAEARFQWVYMIESLVKAKFQ